MIITIIIIIAAIVFSIRTSRDFIIGCFEWVLGTIMDHAPTLGGVILIIGAIIGLLLLIAGSWVGVLVMIGHWANHAMAGWILAIGGTIGFLLGLRWMFAPLKIISVLFILFGIFLPKLDGAISHYLEGSEITIANKLYEETLKMQPDGVQTGKLIEKTIFLDEKGNKKDTLNAGREISIANMKEKRLFPGRTEYFVKAILLDKNKDSDPATEGWVPALKVAPMSLEIIIKEEAKLKAEADAKAKAEAEKKAREFRASLLAEMYTLEVRKWGESATVPEKLIGRWKVYPPDTEYQGTSDPQKMPTYGDIDLKEKEEFVHFTRPGLVPGKITIIKVH